MKSHPLHPLAALAALLFALPSLAADCEDLRAQVEAKIRGAGVARFAVAIVDAGASAPGKVVGSCDRGTKKLVYTQVNATGIDTKASAEPARPASKAAEPILTECKDGTVSMNADCKKKR